MQKPVILYRDIGFMSVAFGEWPCECGALATQHKLRQLDKNRWLLEDVKSDKKKVFTCKGYFPMQNQRDAKMALDAHNQAQKPKQRKKRR